MSPHAKTTFAPPNSQVVRHSTKLIVENNVWFTHNEISSMSIFDVEDISLTKFWHQFELQKAAITFANSGKIQFSLPVMSFFLMSYFQIQIRAPKTTNL